MKPAFVSKKGEFLDRIVDEEEEVRLLARDESMEVVKYEVREGADFTLDSAADWQDFEFVYLLEGRLRHLEEGSKSATMVLEEGDYIARRGVPRSSYFRAETDVVFLYASPKPSFHLIRAELKDLLELIEDVERREGRKGHSKRLERMAYEVGKRMGLSGKKLFDLSYAAFFHDLGKAKVPRQLLRKEGGLSDREWKTMKKHPIWGKELLEKNELLSRTGSIVKQTHERLDGKGYPEGLSDEEITLEAKIIAVVEAYDAMTEGRPYHLALSEEEAVEDLWRNTGSQFDEKVVEVFVKVLEESSSEEEEVIGGWQEDDLDRLRQREYLLELGEDILSQADLDELLGQIAQAIINSTTFNRAIISLYDKAVDPKDSGQSEAKVEKFSSAGLSQKAREKLELLQETDLEVNLEKFKEKFRISKSYYLPHEEKPASVRGRGQVKSELDPEGMEDWHPNDNLYIPLYKGQRIMGQISVDDPEDGKAPTTGRLRPLEGFANLAALAVDKARRALELDRQKRRAEAKRRKLEALHRLTQELSEASTEEEVCQIALETAQSLLEYKFCFFSILKEDQLVPLCTRPDEFSERAGCFELGEGLVERSFQRGETVWGDLEELADGSQFPEDWGSFISVAVGEMGTIQIIAEEEDGFDKEDVVMAELMAEHLKEELQRIRLEKELRDQAVKDPLTELFNRRYFNEIIEGEAERCRRYGHSLGFLMIDINHFKRVNDDYSHLTGDSVLKQMARLVERNVRGADKVVRYGGDEFLVVMPETGEGLGEVKERLERAIQKWNEESQLLAFPLTLAMGHARLRPDRDRDVEEVLGRADRRMYQDKKQKKGE